MTIYIISGERFSYCLLLVLFTFIFFIIYVLPDRMYGANSRDNSYLLLHGTQKHKSRRTRVLCEETTWQKSNVETFIFLYISIYGPYQALSGGEALMAWSIPYATPLRFSQTSSLRVSLSSGLVKGKGRMLYSVMLD